MRPRSRPGYGLFQLLVVVALLAMLLGMLLPAVHKVRLSAGRMRSQNNLKHIAIAMHNYNASNNRLPAGVDDKQFSALFHLLPYLEQDALYKAADRTADCDDKANAEVRATRVKTFESPLDAANEGDPAGGTNYFALAGSKIPLTDNDGAFYRDSKLTLAGFADGTSNTVVFVEMLRGDGGKKTVGVQRQHVRLKAADLATLKVESGVKEWEAGKQIVGDRGSAWIDGRFLRATTNATRGMLDPKPDVDCGGEGGLAGVRMTAYYGTNVAVGDGSVRGISPALSLVTWKAVATTGGGEVLGADW